MKMIARAPAQLKGRNGKPGRDLRPGDTFEGSASDAVPESAVEEAPKEDPAMRKLADEERLTRAEAAAAARKAGKA